MAVRLVFVLCWCSAGLWPAFLLCAEEAGRRPALHQTDYHRELARIDSELVQAADGKRAYLLYLRASLTSDFADFRKAEEAIEDAGLLRARAHLAFKLHRLDAAKRDLALIGSDPVLEADIAFQEGRLDEARRGYEALPPTWDNLARLANLRRSDRLYARASEELTVKEMRDYAWVELQRGLLDLEDGKPAKALEHYDRAAAAWSGWWLIDEHRAEALHLLGRTEEAVAIYRDVVARTNHPELISALAAILRSEELFAKADARFEEQMAMYPEAAAGHYVEHLLRRGGDPAKIVALAERNHAARPNAESKQLLVRARKIAR